MNLDEFIGGGQELFVCHDNLHVSRVFDVKVKAILFIIYAVITKVGNSFYIGNF